MTENKRYVRILDHSEKEVRIFDENNQKNIFNIFFEGLDSAICLNGALEDTVDLLNELNDENKELKEKIEKLQRFEHTGEHIRLSINIETGKLQRHIYATGQWFGDFDRVLCTNWISEEEYQRFIDRVIEVYNTEFKKELSE